mmetsp:Transcript_38417/g.96643  ORF Transcript_38417/g.96643 Transcript_38417/m.96643 type:complete len:438 (-) Transcript_38417:49-1362(-)
MLVQSSVFLLLLVMGATAQQHSGDVAGARYVLGAQGETCVDACLHQHLNCLPHIPGDVAQLTAAFASLGVQCQSDNRTWWATDQPSYVSNPSDPNYGRCLGLSGMPSAVLCSGNEASTERLCYCGDPNVDSHTGAFGTGLSSGAIYQQETPIFAQVAPNSSYGVMTHFWVTATEAVLDDSVFRYYVDGESTPSIEFVPSMACGSGFDDATAPWGTELFGKGAKNGAWFLNFRIPFQKTIRITAQRPSGTAGGFYMIVRGALNLPIDVGGVRIPSTAKLLLQHRNVTLQPLEHLAIVNVPSGSGLFFMHTIAVQSGNMNFLEGCHRFFSPPTQTFPGTQLSTGTEDFFDSAWYFDAGEFRLPVSGFTHLNQTQGSVTWSAYRFHTADPLPFDDGFVFQWRNGDSMDPSGHKCTMQSGGTPVGSPTVSQVQTYAWVYVW